MTDNQMVTLRIEPGAHRVEVPVGTPLSDALELAGVDFTYPCARAGLCGRCRIFFEQGAPDPTEDELRLLSHDDRIIGIRLACRAVLNRDAQVRVTIEEKMRTEHILNQGIHSDIVVDPDVRMFAGALSPSTLEKPRADWLRVVDVLPEGLRSAARPTLSVLQQLPSVVACASDRNTPVTLTVRGNRVIEAHCGDTLRQYYGVALDVGTTTMAASLIDMHTGDKVASAGMLNPQTVYGYDLISRIQAVRHDPKNLGGLQGRVLAAAGELIEQMCAERGLKPASLCAMAVAGNTLMSHLFLGVDPSALGEAPFAGALRAGVRLEARDLDLPIHPHAPVYVLPCIGGFVGGDIVAGMLVSDLQHLKGTSVLIDIGTNGEIAICHEGRMLVTSSAAGPAFEGGKISCGMMARAGAINHVSFDGRDLGFSTLSDEPPRGICGSGLIEIIARSLEVGLLAMNGRIASAESLGGNPAEGALVARLDPDENGPRIRLVDAGEGRRAMHITQSDVREFQLGKGAVSAALSMVLAEAGIGLGNVDRLLVAGAFGNHLNIADAMAIGLLPELPPEKVILIGNASLEGARCVLINRYQRQRAEQIAEVTQWVELAHRPEFQERFAYAMMLGPAMEL